MRVGILTYDYDPPIGGLGAIARRTKDMLQTLFPEDTLIVFSPSQHADHCVSALAELCWRMPGGCPFFSLALVLRLPSLVRRYSLDLVHVHAGSGGVFLLRKPACPLVVTAHHTYLQEAELVFRRKPIRQLWKRLMALLERRTYVLADRIICISKDTEDVLAERYGLPRSKMCVIENAVPLPRARPLLPREERTVLFVGRLEERKGVEVLLQAFSLLGRTHPDARLRLIGKNLMGRRLLSFIEKKHLQSRIALPGFLYDPLLEREMLHATVLVVPSLLEGFGLIAAQGMLAGTCVIASDAPGLRCVVRDTVTGLLFRSGDPVDCAEKIARALDHPELRLQLQEAANMDARQRFDPERRTSDVHAVFASLLDASARLSAC